MELTMSNLKDNLGAKPGDIVVVDSEYNIPFFRFLLQKNYGEENDCTPTAITSIISYLEGYETSVPLVYKKVIKFAKKYLYRPSSGTPAVLTKSIFQKVAPAGKQVKAEYFKDCEYDFEEIKSQIDKNNPVLLLVFNDGMDYYTNHAVTIIGYKVYKVNDKYKRFLKISDNWDIGPGFIDYDKMSSINCIYYLVDKKKSFIQTLLEFIANLFH